MFNSSDAKPAERRQRATQLLSVAYGWMMMMMMMVMWTVWFWFSKKAKKKMTTNERVV
jgi:hypothetical protein